MLCAVARPQQAAQAEADLAELGRLCETAGLTVVERTIQMRLAPDPATYVGAGKARSLAERSAELGGAVVVCDDELSPAQVANLSDLIPAAVSDRTGIILDIFAARARSGEGKLQVELARLNYLLPRLTGRGTEMSRLGGGLFTRGPGESKLELDRRQIRRRIADLQRALADVRRRREMLRDRRRQGGLPLISLVGYTNAGKSTLMNALTGASVRAQDKLFATLDPTTRRLALPGVGQALLTDTVGFIRKLPHQLVAAFRATLEEVCEADLIVHVADASSPDWRTQTETVLTVLRELGAVDKPIVTAYNKIDRLTPEQRGSLIRGLEPLSVAVSAVDGTNLGELVAQISAALPREREIVSFEIPYERADVASLVRERGRVIAEDYRTDALAVTVELDPVWASRIRKRLAEDGKKDDGL